MKNIEVEVRSFISKKEYEQLLEFFYDNADLVKDDEQETHYFGGKHDLRIQKNRFVSKIWLKKGKLHESTREEIEIQMNKNQFENLSKLFKALDKEVKIKWFRKRKMFSWEKITVCLDFTKGYGYIIELEKMSTPEKEIDTLNLLQQKMKMLGLKITPKSEFDKKFKFYEENWKKLI